MEDELYKLEQELRRTEKELESEKTKRTVIMVLFYSVLCGLIFYFGSDEIASKDIISFLVGSLISGAVLYVVPLALHELVTSCFTKVEFLESWKNHLENEIKKRK